MPSARSVGAAGVALLGLVAFVYSLLVAHQPLLGLGVLVLCALVAYAVVADVNRRQAVTGGAIVVVVMLGVLTLRPLVAIVAVCAVYLTSWLTGPNGPYAE